MRNFLWEGTEKSVGAHFVRWNLVTRPKERGGLGIDKINLSNVALLAKWIWRFLEESDDLWKKVIEGKYLSDSMVGIPNKCNNTSMRAPWFHICKLSHHIIENSRWKANSGNKTLFWYHNWTGLGPLHQLLPRFFAMSSNTILTVKEAWNPNEAKWNFFPVQIAERKRNL